MVNIGIVGCGYWGPNLIRNFAKDPNCHVKWLCDINENRFRLLQKIYLRSNFTIRYREIIKDPQIDAIVVATPLETHYDIAKRALLAGKHVFIEKPFVDTSKKAQELVEIAQNNKLVLMAGYTYVFSPAVQKIKKMIESGSLGSVYYANSVRVNFGIFRKKESVIWDLAVHDFSIISYWFNEAPVSVIATGRDSLGRGYVDTSFISVNFKSGLIVYILVSWLSPIKMRNMILTGSKRMIFFNDERGTEKVKIYNQNAKLRTINFSAEYQPTYNRSSVFSPWLEFRETLEIEASHFIECIRKRKNPITDGTAGLKVVKILEAVDKSLKYHKKIYIPQ